MGAVAMEEREELEEEIGFLPFSPNLYPIWKPGGKPAVPGCVPAYRLAAGFAGRCAGPPGEAAGARRACIGILFWPGDEGMTNGPPIFAYLVFGLGKVSLERLLRPIKAAV
jgi:hypothetical protein